MVDSANRERENKNTRAVLVVDDHELVRNLVVSMLTNEGFNVLSAASGPEAIEVVRADSNVHCVLQDLSMPNMRGEEVILEISHIRPDLSVLVYSADEESAVAHRLSHLGIAGYLQKPFDPEALITKIRALMSN